MHYHDESNRVLSAPQHVPRFCLCAVPKDPYLVFVRALDAIAVCGSSLCASWAGRGATVGRCGSHGPPRAPCMAGERCGEAGAAWGAWHGTGGRSAWRKERQVASDVGPAERQVARPVSGVEGRLRGLSQVRLVSPLPEVRMRLGWRVECRRAVIKLRAAACAGAETRPRQERALSASESGSGVLWGALPTRMRCRRRPPAPLRLRTRRAVHSSTRLSQEIPRGRSGRPEWTRGAKRPPLRHALEGIRTRPRARATREVQAGAVKRRRFGQGEKASVVQGLTRGDRAGVRAGSHLALRGRRRQAQQRAVRLVLGGGPLAPPLGNDRLVRDVLGPRPRAGAAPRVLPPEAPVFPPAVKVQGGRI